MVGLLSRRKLINTLLAQVVLFKHSFTVIIGREPTTIIGWIGLWALSFKWESVILILTIQLNITHLEHLD